MTSCTSVSGLSIPVVPRLGIFVVLLVVLLSGCQENKKSQVVPQSQLGETRNTERSRELNEQGLSQKTSPETAEHLFRRAIEADPFNAAAHNNLGVTFMKLGQYYEAAKAFEQTIKLQPANPQPRVNLGLLCEMVGELRNAHDQYEQALVVSPEYIDAIQPLARVRIRQGMLDRRTAELLRSIAIRSGDAQWRDWARKELSRSWALAHTASEWDRPEDR